MTWASTMRKWSRTIHRDLSYFFSGVLLVYVFSGFMLLYVDFKRKFSAETVPVRNDGPGVLPGPYLIIEHLHLPDPIGQLRRLIVCSSIFKSSTSQNNNLI